MTDSQLQNDITRYRQALTELYNDLEVIRNLAKRLDGRETFTKIDPILHLTGENSGLSPDDLQISLALINGILTSLPEGTDKTILKVIY